MKQKLIFLDIDGTLLPPCGCTAGPNKARREA